MDDMNEYISNNYDEEKNLLILSLLKSNEKNMKNDII